MKRFYVVYKIKETRSTVVEAKSEEDAYETCAIGPPGKEVIIDSEYVQDVSCEEFAGVKP